MRRSRIMSWAIVVIIMAGLVAGCAQTPEPAATAVPTTAPAKTSFVVATDAAFPPMEFVDDTKNIVGFDIDLMAAVAKAAGFTVEWKNTAWDGIFAGLESGDYDAIMSAVTITDERKQKYDFSDPYINAGQAVIVRMDETAIASDKDLGGKTVGAQIGTTGAFAVEEISGATLKEYDTIDLALLDLVNGNIDAVVVDTPVAADYALAAETFKGKLKIVGEPFTDEFYGIVARKGDDALLKLFNEGLKKVQASGEYDTIYAKWISGQGVEKVSGLLPAPEWSVAKIPAGKTIKIGQAGPMTGDYAAFGIDISRGAELAVKEMPEIKGFKVEFLTEDTQGSPEQGAAVANKFAADPQMVGIEGHVFSGSTEAAIPIYEKAGIVMVSPSATNPSLTTLGSQVFNRVAFTDQQQGEFAAKYLYETLGVRNIVTMHDGGAYGQGLAAVTAETFKSLGGTVLGTEAITPGETDYSAPLAAIAALSPELIYFGGYDADAAVLVSQMAGAGLADTLFFGCDGTYGTNYIDLAGKAAEGTYSTYVPIPESDAFTKFREQYKADYGDEQGKLSPFSPHGHDSMAVILNAINKVAVVESDGSLSVDRKALAEAVRATKDFAGLTGSITCSANGECAAAAVQFMIVKDGEWTVAEGMAGTAAEDPWGVAVIPAGKTIKIGQAGPMTGDYAAFGIDISRGAELAVKEMPEIKGFKVEFLTEDTQGSPEQGAAVANKFAADPQMVGIEGHVFSGSTEAAIPIYEKAGIVMVSPSATNPSLTTLGSQVFNRVAFTDQQQGEFAAKYLYETLGVRNIVTMHDGGAYGQGLAAVTAETFKSLGGTVLGTEAITPGETDYSAPLAAIAALSPELIYFGGYDADAAVLVSQMAGAGLADTLFFGCDGTYGTNYIDLAGKAAEGTYSTYVPIPESDAFTKFREQYKADYGDEQGKLSPFSPHGHDSMAVLLNAINKVAVVQSDGSLAIPRKALADAVRATKGFAGLTGSITCSANGECAAASVQFMIVKDGEWVVAEGMP